MMIVTSHQLILPSIKISFHIIQQSIQSSDILETLMEIRVMSMPRGSIYLCTVLHTHHIPTNPYRPRSNERPQSTFNGILRKLCEATPAQWPKFGIALRVAKTDYPRAIPFAITSRVDQRLNFNATIRGVVNFTHFLGPYGDWQNANLDSVSNCLATPPIAISQMISIGTR